VLERGFRVEPLDLRFTEVPQYSFPGMAGLAIADAAVRDFDLDSDLDILIAASGAESRILLNNGSGNFTDSTEERPVADDPDAGEEEDGDGDEDAGAADVFEVLDVEEEPADVPPEYVFDPYKRLPGWEYTTRAVAVYDFDGDGDEDIFVCNGPDEPNAFYVNDGTAHFVDMAATVLPEDGDNCLHAAAADIDRDGLIDVVTVNILPDEPEPPPDPPEEDGPLQIKVYLNQGRGSTPARPVTFEVEQDADIPQRDEVVASIAVADVDGDGYPDIILSYDAGDGPYVKLLLNKSANMIPDATSGIRFMYANDDALPSPAGPVSHVEAGDVDGDRDADVVAISTEGQDRLLINDGRGHFFDDTFSSLPVDRASGRFAFLADMDLSGVRDILIANYGAQNRLYLHRDPANFIDKTPALPMYIDATVMALSLDADGDGDEDIVFLNAGDDTSRLCLSVEP